MDDRAALIRDNYSRVSERIAQAARQAGRDPAGVGLVVVTKAQPIEVVRAALEAGARILGENYPEETLPKIQTLGHPNGAQWHMIGHLQSRKASIIAADFDVLESLDSYKLAERLERLLAERERTLPVLLECNVSGEESKFGYPAWQPQQWDTLLPEVEQILALPHLALRGLMTMPPLYDDPEQTRPFFARLHELGDFLSRRFGAEHFRDLSMGTSADFEAAVQEGATLVRIGTAIVGPRPKKAAAQSAPDSV